MVAPTVYIIHVSSHNDEVRSRHREKLCDHGAFDNVNMKPKHDHAYPCQELRLRRQNSPAKHLEPSLRALNDYLVATTEKVIFGCYSRRPSPSLRTQNWLKVP